MEDEVHCSVSEVPDLTVGDTEQEATPEEVDDAELTDLPIPFLDQEVYDWGSELAGSNVNSTVVTDESSDDGFGPQVDVGPQIAESVEKEPVLSVEQSQHLNNVWSRQVHHATAYNRTQLVLPWERFEQNLCTAIRYPALTVPRWIPDRTVISDINKSTPGTAASPNQTMYSESAWWAVKQRVSSVDWQSQLDSKRRLAYERCRVLLQLDPSHTELGRLILADIHTLASDEAITSSVMNVFANKATKTILKRSSAFQKFVAWCMNKNIKPYPVLEATAYAYLSEVSFKSPSFASSFKESLNFMHGTLGIDGCKQSAESRRLNGICINRSLMKRPRVQAPPLTTRQVSFMEEFVCSDGDMNDRCFVGHCLLCVYTRSRWDDLQHACEPKLDFTDNEGYFELSSLVTKTSTNVAKKTTFLPMVCPVPGITNYPWLEQFLMLRKDLKLPDFNKHDPCMPVILTSGQWGKMALSSSQAGEWIRLIFNSGGVAKSFSRVTSHSFKATLLSWAAKGGLSKEHRCILGYHTLDSNQSMLHYSRDEQAAPLRALKRLLHMIKQGQFIPDNTRS
jgi:hypothetical protein